MARYVKQLIYSKTNCFNFIICLTLTTNFLFNHQAFSQSLNSSNESDDLQAQNSIDDLDYQQLTEVSEFCRTNEQASDLCYLLAEDVLDYSDLGYDLQIDHNFGDYAQSVGVVSIPVFLRYLPVLSKLAKNNMIVATAMAIVGGSIIFKKYYDSFSQTLMMKAQGVDGSLTTFRLEQVKSSKSFKYYSQKGPEHEDNKLVPFFQKQAHSEEQKDKKPLAEFKEYIKLIKKWNDSAHSSEYADLRIEQTQLKEIMELLVEILNNDADFVLTNFVLKEIDGDDLSDFEKKFARTISIRAFNDAKLAASTSTFYDTFHRSKWYKTAKIKSQELYTEMASSLVSFTKNLFTNQLKKPSEVIEAIQEIVLVEPSDLRRIWDALLLERLAHLQLLESMKDPDFEKKYYLPFLTKLIEKSTDLQIHDIVDQINIQKIQQYSDQAAQLQTTDKSLTESTATIPSLETNLNSGSDLLPSNYLDYQNLSTQQLKDYIDLRFSMLKSMQQIVHARVSVWERQGMYQFIPGKAKSDQALAQWTELFELATHPLVYHFFELSD